jgi:hypothetical protein
MAAEFDDDWSMIRRTLTDCLAALDRRDEPLIAIYVATALEQMEARQQAAADTVV